MDFSLRGWPLAAGFFYKLDLILLLFGTQLPLISPNTIQLFAKIIINLHFKHLTEDPRRGARRVDTQMPGEYHDQSRGKSRDPYSHLIVALSTIIIDVLGERGSNSSKTAQLINTITDWSRLPKLWSPHAVCSGNRRDRQPNDYKPHTNIHRTSFGNYFDREWRPFPDLARKVYYQATHKTCWRSVCLGRYHTLLWKGEFYGGEQRLGRLYRWIVNQSFSDATDEYINLS